METRKYSQKSSSWVVLKYSYMPAPYFLNTALVYRFATKVPEFNYSFLLFIGYMNLSKYFSVSEVYSPHW